MNSLLESQVASARTKIDSRGELPYGVRVQLLRALDESRDAKLGWRRRSMLAIACARKCAQFWVVEGSEIEMGPVLGFAEQCMCEWSMFPELEGVATNLKVEVDNVLALGDRYFRAAYAGFSTVAAIETVIRDECLDDSAEGEQALNVSRWSSAFWASCAHSGSATWEPVTDDTARLAFWLWYLDEAVPSAVDG